MINLYELQKDPVTCQDLADALRSLAVQLSPKSIVSASDSKRQESCESFSSLGSDSTSADRLPDRMTPNHRPIGELRLKVSFHNYPLYMLTLILYRIMFGLVIVGFRDARTRLIRFRPPRHKESSILIKLWMRTTALLSIHRTQINTPFSLTLWEHQQAHGIRGVQFLLQKLMSSYRML
jgi:hypothetical protein